MASHGGCPPDPPESKDSPKMHLARDLLQAVGDKASNLIAGARSSSSIAKFGIETIETLGHPLRSFTARKWEVYGEPWLNTFDDTLDRAITAVKYSFSEDESSSNENSENRIACDDVTYNLYWERVKEMFLKSRWFAQVDRILQENGVLKLVKTNLLRPAEMFFNTAAEVFGMEKSIDRFLLVLRKRVGVVWDGRLADLAKSFYRAAEKISESIGAKKCFQGLLNLGKARKDMAMNDLVSHFGTLNSNNGSTQQVDSKSSPQAVSTKGKKRERDSANLGKPLLSTPTMDVQMISESDSKAMSYNDSYLCANPMMENESFLSRDLKIRQNISCPEPRKRVRKSAEKLKSSRRLRHMYPYTRKAMPQVLKHKLTQKRWFSRVDYILGQNDFIKALSKNIVPSQHFFQTALRILRSDKNSEDSDEFTTMMTVELGFAWDKRLGPLAEEFYHASVGTFYRRGSMSNCRS